MVKSIVIVGSCMIDFTCHSPRFPKPGETICGTLSKISYGGKGANQCVAAAKLGASTSLIASLGSDIFASQYISVLKKENVDVSHVRTCEDISSGNAYITVTKNGENSIVIIPGANDLLSIKQVDSAIDLIKHATVLLCQFETPLETTLHALKLHKGHGISIVNGAPATANVNPEIFKLCDIFCVNETEAEIITGIQPLKLSNAQEAVDKLLSEGCNTVIVTLGALGAVYASQAKREITRVPTIEVQPVDTTGAGDAFLGALAYFKCYHPELSMDECIRRSCVVASKSILKFGTQTSFPAREELTPDLFI